MKPYHTLILGIIIGIVLARFNVLGIGGRPR